MRKLFLSVSLAFLAACGGVPETGIETAASAAPVKCQVGYERHGNRCVKIVTPTPTPTPTPTVDPIPVVEPPPTTEEPPIVTTEPVPSPIGDTTAPPLDTTQTDEPAPTPSIELDPAREAIVLQNAIRDASIPGLQPSWPGETVGAFRFICGSGQLLYDDPILFPGEPGKSHLHQYFGNLDANANSTHDSLLMHGDSTCNFTGTGTPGNASAYWISAMLNGKGQVVQPDYIQVYYKRSPEGPYPQEIIAKIEAYLAAHPTVSRDNLLTGCQRAIKVNNSCIGIIDGIQFIQGFDMVSGTFSYSATGWFQCSGVGAENKVHKQTADALSFANLTTCPVGSKVEMAISSAKCVNGDLDSSNHISHLSGMISVNYQSQCPSTHPYIQPVFTIAAFYTVREGDDPALWSLASDASYPNLPRGATLHFDYKEAWWKSVKNMWEKFGCIEKYLNCSGGNLGNGKTLIGAGVPTYNIGGVMKTSWTNPNHLVDIPPRPANDNTVMNMAVGH